MIKSVTLKDFEGHADRTFDFADGFNTITGLSDVGKSSIARALRLVAFNDWTEEYIRLGKKQTSVTVVTDRGTVKVIRSKSKNEWEINYPDGRIEKLEKVGAKPVPAAQDILGIYEVEMANSKVAVQMASQMENHFLLAGVGDKTASGNMRAQIIDELTGLGGLESIISDIVGEVAGHKRRANEAFERERIELDSKHDEAELEQLEAKVAKLDSLTGEAGECENSLAAAKSYCSNAEDLKSNISVLEDAVTSLPDVECLKTLMGRAEQVSMMYDKGKSQLSTANKVGSLLADAEKQSLELLDIDTLKPLLLDSEAIYNELNNAKAVLLSCKKYSERIADVNGLLANYEEFELANSNFTKALSMKNDLDKMKSLQTAITELGTTGKMISQKLNEASVALKTATKEQTDLLASVTTCPLTDKPCSTNLCESKTCPNNN